MRIATSIALNGPNGESPTHSVLLICRYRAARAAKNDFSVDTQDLQQNDQIFQ